MSLVHSTGIESDSKRVANELAAHSFLLILSNFQVLQVQDVQDVLLD